MAKERRRGEKTLGKTTEAEERIRTSQVKGLSRREYSKERQPIKERAVGGSVVGVGHAHAQSGEHDKGKKKKGKKSKHGNIVKGRSRF